MKHVGNLEIRTQADADKYTGLTEVTGYLYIHASAKLDAPALESVGGDLYIYEKCILTANKLYTGGYDKFTVIDGIPCVVLSKKNQDGVCVSLCRKAQIKNQKVIGDRFYVAQQGHHNAHGKTIAEATQELAFKAGSRDVSQWRNMPMSTKKTPQEWAFIYRMVTGACQYGTQEFMKRKGELKKSYTLAEIIEETKGAYGHERFVEVVS